MIAGMHHVSRGGSHLDAALRFVLLRGSGTMPFLEPLQCRSPQGAPCPSTASPAVLGAHHVALVADA